MAKIQSAMVSDFSRASGFLLNFLKLFYFVIRNMIDNQIWTPKCSEEIIVQFAMPLIFGIAGL